jgi:hypothetical protein
MHRQRASNRDALLFAARQRSGYRRAASLRPDRFEQFVALQFRFLRGSAQHVYRRFDNVSQHR